MDKPGTELAADLSDAAAKLYEKLVKGYYWDGRKKRKINHDITKLSYAYDLSREERNLVRDLTFLSSTCAGTQEIRIMIGHSLFGARVEYGEPLFLTISPSSRHSALTVRCSRYRKSDPAMVFDPQPKTSVPAWAGQFVPRLWQDVSQNHAEIDVPYYGLRRIIAAYFACELQHLPPEELGVVVAVQKGRGTRELRRRAREDRLAGSQQ